MPADPNTTDPSIIRVLLDGAFGLGLALVGGLLVMLQRLAAGTYRNRWGPFVDLVAAGFAGLLAYTVCLALKIDYYWTSFFVGMAGHAGVRFLKWAEDRVVAFLKKRGF